MEPLVEVHASCELNVALEAGAKVIGVNNRNLHTFQMDLATTDRTADALEERNCTFHHNLGTEDGTSTAEYSICALSGMSSAQDVDRYRQKGVGMCLIGESLMRAADPKAAIQSLCLHPNDYETYMTESTTASVYTAGMNLVKVCGITPTPTNGNHTAAINTNDSKPKLSICYLHHNIHFGSANELLLFSHGRGGKSISYTFANPGSTGSEH